MIEYFVINISIFIISAGGNLDLFYAEEIYNLDR